MLRKCLLGLALTAVLISSGCCRRTSHCRPAVVNYTPVAAPCCPTAPVAAPVITPVPTTSAVVPPPPCYR